MRVVGMVVDKIEHHRLLHGAVRVEIGEFISCQHSVYFIIMKHL